MLHIQLNQQEAILFDLLQQVGAYHNVVLRAIGGWVRDKLLGNDSSYDIDITVVGMSGTSFAEAVSNFQSQHTGEITSIKPNLEKQAATTKVGIYQLNFVQLQDPVKDAFDRDLTINSISWNIMERRIEDFTQVGILHLQNHIIDTPQDPSITIGATSLRIMRIIRFSLRFNFNLSERISQALSNQQVVSQLQLVSRGRFQQEIIKIFQQVFKGLEIFCRFPLVFHEVFVSVFQVSSPKFIIANVTAADWCQQVQKYVNMWLYNEECIDMGITAALKEFFNIYQMTYTTKNVKPILCFLILAAPFRSKVFDVETEKVKLLQAMSTNSRYKVIYEPMQHLIPFVACAQSNRLGLITKQVYQVLHTIGQIQSEIELKVVEQGQETTIEERRIISLLFNIDMESLFILLVLDAIPNSPFSKQITRLFRYYNLEMQILKTRPTVSNLQEIATRCNVLDHKQYGLFKEQLTIFQLSFPSYPDLNEDWQECFIGLYLKGRIQELKENSSSK